MVSGLAIRSPFLTPREQGDAERDEYDVQSELQPCQQYVHAVRLHGSMVVLKLLGFVWLLPATIPFWLFYLFPLMLSGNIRFSGWEGFGIARFVLVGRSGWYWRLWRGWVGFGGPCCLIHKPMSDGPVLRRTIAHERRHCLQHFVFGPFFFPAYLLCSAAIWVYGTVTDADVHAYLDNPFELDARKAAGQPVTIPRDHWPHGRNDRLPWW